MSDHDHATLDDMMTLLRWSVRRCEECRAPATRCKAISMAILCDACSTPSDSDLPEAVHLRRLTASGIYFSRVRP